MWCSTLLLGLGIVILCGLQAGLCVETADTVPESGTVVGGLEGTQDVSLYCAIRSGDIPIQTNWFVQTPEDREAGGVGDLISADNEKFILSGEVLNINISGDITSVPSNTNLTIVSLTGDLQHVTILCISGQGTTLANFPLEVYVPPRLSDMGVVRRRENVDLRLVMSEPDTSLAFPFPNFMWTGQDGVELVNSTGREYGYPSIFIGSVQPPDTGNYTLTASNDHGTASASFFLDVLFEAGLGGSADSVAVLEGDPATLVCGTDLTGNPIPLVQWTDNNGIDVMEGGRYTLSSGRDVVSLTIDTTDTTDTGYWNCTAQVYENGTDSLRVGEAVMRSIRLVVVVPPFAPEDFQEEGIGSTWVAFSWHQEDKGIPPFSQQVILVVGGGEKKNVTIDRSDAATNVTGLLPGTSYTFRVVVVSRFEGVLASSPISFDSFNATTTTTVPAPVCTEAPKVVNDRLVVTWTYTHTGGEPITSVDVFFNPDTSPDQRQAFSDVPDSMLEEVTALDRADSIPLPEAGIHYEFTVRAVNVEGETDMPCPNLRLNIGKPARPLPPTVDKDGGRVTITVTTPHSGVRDSSDDFKFILQIRDSDGQTQDPIERSESVDCPAGGQLCTASISLTSGGGIKEGKSYIVSVRAENRYGQSEETGNSNPFTIGAGGGGGQDDSSSGSSAGVIVGGVIGALVIIALVILIIFALFFILRMRTGRSFGQKGNGQGVRVEEVDIGDDLNSHDRDPNKELHYAELEHFRKPDLLPPEKKHKTVEEPVQYATLQELKPQMKSNGSAVEVGDGGEEGVKGGGGEGEKEGDGDKAQTSSTFV